jgi:hypothetical protein
VATFAEMPIYDSEIENAVAAYAAVAEKWFRARFLQPELFEERLRAGLRFSRGDTDQHETKKIELTRSLGLFSFELFRAMVVGGESYKPLLISILWDRLLDAGLMLQSLPLIPGGGTPLVTHQISEKALAEHLNDGTFANLFASPSRLPQTYAQAVVSIDVMKKDVLHRGTGFVVEADQRQFLMTCKHNVDPADGLAIKKITSTSGDGIETGDFVLSERYDIAVGPLKTNVAKRAFVLSDKVDVFDEVFTLGYPLVPRAEPLLLCHRGEMNGHANLYVEKCPALIISNLVSPGSSGGPVLIRDGHCVGMTINWLEGEKQGEEGLERMRFSAALPAKLLQEAVRANF